MGIVVANSLARLSQSIDFMADCFKLLGSLDDIEVYYNHILVAIYVRPEKTRGGIIRPDSNKEEDIYQGKTGLVIKKGPMAFVDDGDCVFNGQNVEVGDWVVYRAADGWSITVNGTENVACRMLVDRNIKLRVKSPERTF